MNVASAAAPGPGTDLVRTILARIEHAEFGEPAERRARIKLQASAARPLEGLRIGVDAAEPKVYPFSFCSAAGCVARVGFTAAEVDAFKAGNNAIVTIVPAVAPDQTVVLEVSLKGFTAGYEAVAAAQAAVDAAQAAAPAEPQE